MKMKKKQAKGNEILLIRQILQIEGLVCGVLSLAKRSKLLFILFIFMKKLNRLCEAQLVAGGNTHPPTRVTQYTKL